MTDSPSKEDFLNKFSVLFEKSGMTAQELANALGVSRPTVERWAAGTQAPHKVLRRLVLEYFEEKNG